MKTFIIIILLAELIVFVVELLKLRGLLREHDRLLCSIKELIDSKSEHEPEKRRYSESYSRIKYFDFITLEGHISSYEEPKISKSGRVLIWKTLFTTKEKSLTATFYVSTKEPEKIEELKKMDLIEVKGELFASDSEEAFSVHGFKEITSNLI